MTLTFSFRLETSTTGDIFRTLTCGKRSAAAVALIIAALAVIGLVAPDARVVVKPVRNGEIPVGDANASVKFSTIDKNSFSKLSMTSYVCFFLKKKYTSLWKCRSLLLKSILWICCTKRKCKR